MIRALLPKEQHASLFVVQDGVSVVITWYNEGSEGAAEKLSEGLGLRPGVQALSWAREKDVHRLHKAKTLSKRTKQKRVTRRLSSTVLLPSSIGHMYTAIFNFIFHTRCFCLISAASAVNILGIVYSISFPFVSKLYKCLNAGGGALFVSRVCSHYKRSGAKLVGGAN